MTRGAACSTSCDAAYSSSPKAGEGLHAIEEGARCDQVALAQCDDHRPRLIDGCSALPATRLQACQHDDTIFSGVDHVIDLLAPFLPGGV